MLFYYAGSSLIGWSGGFFLSGFGWGGVIGLICALLLLTGLLVVQLIRSPAKLERKEQALKTV